MFMFTVFIVSPGYDNIEICVKTIFINLFDEDNMSLSFKFG